MHFLTEYLVAVLISTEEVVRARQMKEHKIDERSSMGSLDVAVPVGREADMAEVGLIESLDGELICGVAVLLIFFSSI